MPDPHLDVRESCRVVCKEDKSSFQLDPNLLLDKPYLLLYGNGWVKNCGKPFCQKKSLVLFATNGIFIVSVGTFSS